MCLTMEEKQQLMIKALVGLRHTQAEAQEIAQFPRPFTQMFDVAEKTNLKKFMWNPEKGSYIVDFCSMRGPNIHYIVSAGPKRVVMRLVTLAGPVLEEDWIVAHNGFSMERHYLEKACLPISDLNIKASLEIIAKYRTVEEMAEPWSSLIIAYEVLQEIERL